MKYGCLKHQGLLASYAGSACDGAIDNAVMHKDIEEKRDWIEIRLSFNLPDGLQSIRISSVSLLARRLALQCEHAV